MELRFFCSVFFIIAFFLGGCSDEVTKVPVKYGKEEGSCGYSGESLESFRFSVGKLFALDSLLNPTECYGDSVRLSHNSSNNGGSFDIVNVDSRYVLVRYEFTSMDSQAAIISFEGFIDVERCESWDGVDIVNTLLLERIQTLFKEGYSLDASKIIAGNELREFLGDSAKGSYLRDLEKEYRSLLWRFIIQGDTAKNVENIAKFKQDFADGVIDDTLFVFHAIDYLISVRYSYEDYFPLAKRYFNAAPCEYDGQRISLANSASVYANDSIYCDSRLRLRPFDPLEYSLGLCRLDALGTVKCDVDSVCYKCNEYKWIKVSP